MRRLHVPAWAIRAFSQGLVQQVWLARPSAVSIEEGEDEEDEEVVKALDGMTLHLSSRGKGSTPYTGVTRRSSGRFLAQYKRDGTYKALGTFDTAVEAAVAYYKHVESIGAGVEEEGEEEADEEEDEEELSPVY